MKRHAPLPLFLVALVLAACSSIVGDTPTDPGNSTDSTTADPSTTTTAADCIRFTGDHSSNIDSGSVAGDALFLSGETFLCANDVVVVSSGELNEVVAASQLAAALKGPLLFPEPRLAAELGRLKPERVHVVGSPDVNTPDNAETVQHDIASAIELAGATIGASETLPVPARADSSTIVETVLAINAADRVTKPAEMPPTSSTTGTPPQAIEEPALVDGLAIPTDSSSIWMVDASRPETILVAAAVGQSIGATVVAIDGSDILGYPEVATALEGHGNDTLRFIGGTPADSEWQLAVLTTGQQVPGGGFYVLPEDQPRRYVAAYGHPGAASLGVLGEQGPAETRARMDEFIAAYGGDGSQVVPTYEIIATVAAAGPGDDGDYSTEFPTSTFDDWISYARDNGIYVILDLQPGREDFLTQAMLYEDLLKLPFVGLALDPEWRLKEDEVHLVQAGSVDAAEINQVVTWLGDLVRDNGLPQKMLLLHQFKTSMITNRDQIALRPELQIIIQMDGDGTEAQKDSTWSVLRDAVDTDRYAWGWKNFFDEDEPGPPSPESTMSKVPSPVLVSYQ